MRVGAISALATVWLLPSSFAEEFELAGGDALVEHLAHQRVAVAVEAARREADQRVAFADGRSVDHLVAFDDADAETDELEFAFRVHAGHRGGLAAEQCTARALAAFGQAAQRVGGDLGVEPAHRDVVEEDDGLGALDDEVVHDHRDAVDADRVVAPDLRCELELRADTVGRGDEDRFLVAVGRLEQPGEAADRRQHLRPERAARDLLDLVDEAFVVVEVDAGLCVGGSRGRGGGLLVGITHRAPFLCRSCGCVQIRSRRLRGSRMPGRARTVGSEVAARWRPAEAPASPPGPSTEGRGARRSCYRAPVKIAVVIPALDESRHVAATLDALRAGAIGSDSSAELEVVVVDGGSADATADLSRAHGARVVTTGPGRARQLQAGLDAVAGDAVVFLHADTRLPSGWAAAIERTLAAPGVAGGAFRFGFALDGETSFSSGRRAELERVERWAVRRARWLGLVYGDQAIFAHRSALDAIGGVPQAPLMEDVDLVARLRAKGRFVQLDDAVATSPRRYLERGVRPTVWKHAVAIVGWLLGAPRPALARWLGR